MIKWSRIGVVLGLLAFCNWVTVRSIAQTIERNTKVTGPRGRSIDRQVDIQRGPGTFSHRCKSRGPGVRLTAARQSSEAGGVGLGVVSAGSVRFPSFPVLVP